MGGVVDVGSAGTLFLQVFRQQFLFLHTSHFLSTEVVRLNNSLDLTFLNLFIDFLLAEVFTYLYSNWQKVPCEV